MFIVSDGVRDGVRDDTSEITEREEMESKELTCNVTNVMLYLCPALKMLSLNLLFKH
jgi:hypothetical protein